MHRKHFYIFRHGETDWNAEGRFQGHIDIPLNEQGRAQARKLMDVLKPSGMQAVLSSDLSRALETAQIVAAGLGIPVFSEVGLREAHLGEAQGMTYEEIRIRFGEDVLGRWRSDFPTDADVSYPGGETGAEVMARVFATVERFALDPRNSAYSQIGISCHGGVIRRMMQRIRPPGSPPVKIPNTVLYRLVWDPLTGEWQIFGSGSGGA